MHIISVNCSRERLRLLSAIFALLLAVLLLALWFRSPSVSVYDDGAYEVSVEGDTEEKHYPGEPVRVSGQADRYWLEQLSALE